MNQDLKNKLVTLRTNSETDMVYYRNRMNEAIDEGDTKNRTEFYQSKFNEAKAYLSGIMDTLNLIAQDQAK